MWIIDGVERYIMVQAWLIFVVSSAAVFWAGSHLTANAEKIARLTGLGGLWVGLIILPFSTSLPELVSSWRAISLEAPDLAVGNFLGSNMFNLTIIALIDLVQGEGSLFKLISKRHKKTTYFLIIMTFLVIAGIAFPVNIISLSPVTPLLFILYLTAGFVLRKKDETEAEEQPAWNRGEFIKAAAGYLVASAIIVFAALKLADAAETLAVLTGLGQTFVGSTFLAISTSLPEVVTTTTAARMGLLDMAVGNILGANMMNLNLLFVIDLFYSRGALLAAVSPLQYVTAAMGIAITTLVLYGIKWPSDVVLGDISLNSLFILAGFISAVVVLFLLGGTF